MGQIVPTSKKCPHCNKIKDLSCFHKRKYMDNGIGRTPQSWCKECSNQSTKKYYSLNKKLISERRKYWGKTNKNDTIKIEYREKSRVWQSTHRKKKRQDPLYKLNQAISTNIRKTLKYKGESKNYRRWELLVGYSRKDLIKHLEYLFQDGMSWDNYGEWHIDHIIPISVFNYKNTDHIDFKRCWSLDNLRPLWASENERKGAKLEKPFQPSLAL